MLRLIQCTPSAAKWPRFHTKAAQPLSPQLPGGVQAPGTHREQPPVTWERLLHRLVFGRTPSRDDEQESRKLVTAQARGSLAFCPPSTSRKMRVGATRSHHPRNTLSFGARAERTRAPRASSRTANHATTAAQQMGLHVMEGLRFLLSKNIVKNWMIQKRSTHLYDLALPDVSLRVEGLFHVGRGRRKARPRLQPQPLPCQRLRNSAHKAESEGGDNAEAAGSGRQSGATEATSEGPCTPHLPLPQSTPPEQEGI